MRKRERETERERVVRHDGAPTQPPSHQNETDATVASLVFTVFTVLTVVLVSFTTFAVAVAREARPPVPRSGTRAGGRGLGRARGALGEAGARREGDWRECHELLLS